MPIGDDGLFVMDIGKEIADVHLGGCPDNSRDCEGHNSLKADRP